jgi:hypothetical protein
MVDKLNFFDEKSKKTATGVIRLMRDTFNLPVNFIQSDEQEEFDITNLESNISAFKRKVELSDHYKWCTIMGRYVFYSCNPVWDHEISEINIAGISRLNAATQYLAEVRSQIPALIDLTGPPMKGEPLSLVYTELVYLSPVSSLIKHLVELLGTNEKLVFTIERALSGQRVLHFQEVQHRSTQS